MTEKEESFGLNWYETDFRGYDAQIGRFHQIDALSEDYYDWTPYNFVGNNPILLLDPYGLDWYKSNESGEYEWIEGNGEQEGYTYVGDENHVFEGGVLSEVEVSAGMTTNEAQGKRGARMMRKNTKKFGDGLVDVTMMLAHLSPGGWAISGAEMYAAFDAGDIESIAWAAITTAAGYGAYRFLKGRNQVKLNKNASQNQDDRIGSFGAGIKNQKIQFNNNVSANGQFDFIIDSKGNLIIGDGHFKMSGKARAVSTGGTVTLSNGKITTITNNSGHYPSSTRGLSRAVKYFRDAGLLTKNATSLNMKNGKVTKL